VATLAAVVGIGAAVALPRHDAAITPAKPGPTTASPAPDDKYEFCTGTYAPELDVAVATSELKFAYGCYRVRAGAGSVTFTNPQPVPHNLVVAPEGGEPFFKTEVLQPKPGETASIDALLVTGLKAGDYSLTCMVHPSMHAMLVVR
jgi:plastocyanin